MRHLFILIPYLEMINFKAKGGEQSGRKMEEQKRENGERKGRREIGL